MYKTDAVLAPWSSRLKGENRNTHTIPDLIGAIKEEQQGGQGGLWGRQEQGGHSWGSCAVGLLVGLEENQSARDWRYCQLSSQPATGTVGIPWSLGGHF